MISKNGEQINLTPIEYKLLMFFVKNPNQIFGREELIEKVLGFDFKGYDRTIDAHIKNLRRKIENNSKDPKYIITVFGVGYRFEGEKT